MKKDSQFNPTQDPNSDKRVVDSLMAYSDMQSAQNRNEIRAELGPSGAERSNWGWGIVFEKLYTKKTDKSFYQSNLFTNLLIATISIIVLFGMWLYYQNN